ncbi:MAG: glycine--tRNA ligase [Verrucomicrobiota bacterium]
MEKIVSLCKRRGFIYQSSEIYGGINGFWDYGPLGAELKRNVKELWWNAMNRRRDDVVGLEATIIMSPQIWKASGHVDTFADLMRECPMTKKRVRADQVEPQSGIAHTFLGAGEATKIECWLKLFPADQRDQKIAYLFDEFLKEQKRRLAGTPTVFDLTKQEDRLEKDAVESIRLNSISILLPEGKPEDSAKKKAREYFAANGFSEPFLPVSSANKISDSIDYHPESGFKLTEPRPFNLMFKTYVGPVESEDNVAYLRPETAQAIFAQFKNVLETSRQKVPFGIAQVGKAFRNEVTPRNFTFRSREFEQMELEFFIKPDEVVEAIAGRVASAAEIGNRKSEIGNPDWGWEAWHKYWVEERIAFYESIGLPKNSLVEYWQKPEELAHYARACVDILYKFPFSKRDENGELTGEELEGIAARSDFDLSQHERFSGKPMGVFDEELRAAWGKLDEAKKAGLSKRYYEARLKYLTKMGVEPAKAEKEAKEDADGLAKGQYIPHVIEPSAGVDRLILALICNAYSEAAETDDKGKTETRVILKFHPRVAPIKVAVLPLLKNKPDLVRKAQEVRDRLRSWMNVFYDDGGSIGRRYARQDEAGTPFCVTIDFDTLGEKPELKDTVTIRYRDDGKQERLAIGELLNWLLPKIR